MSHPALCGDIAMIVDMLESTALRVAMQCHPADALIGDMMQELHFNGFDLDLIDDATDVIMIAELLTFLPE